WATAGGAIPDVVEIYVDDGPAVRARRCDARPDVAESGVAPRGVAVAVGFSGQVPIQPTAGGRRATVIVRAEYADGTAWQFRPVRVHLDAAPRDAHGEPPLDSPFGDCSVARRGSADGATPRVCVITHSLRIGGGELYLQELLLRLAREHVAQFRVIAPEDGPL